MNKSTQLSEQTEINKRQKTIMKNEEKYLKNNVKKKEHKFVTKKKVVIVIVLFKIRFEFCFHP